MEEKGGEEMGKKREKEKSIEEAFLRKNKEIYWLFSDWDKRERNFKIQNMDDSRG